MATSGRPWSGDEITSVVESYFRILVSELSGNPVVKASENRIVQQDTGRSKGSVEFKFQNVSAVLVENGLVSVDGYKPAVNYQFALGEATLEYVNTHPEVLELMTQFVQAPASPRGADYSWPTEFSAVPNINFPDSPGGPDFTPRHVDFVALEAANKSLGNAGEELVVDFEKYRLRNAGRADLAKRVRHVSRVDGDGAGFDVLSFEPSNAEERYIEVKTTRRGIYAPFHLSRNEVAFSGQTPQQFTLYRLFDFAKPRRGIYALSGDLQENCSMEATQFLARPKGA